MGTETLIGPSKRVALFHRDASDGAVSGGASVLTKLRCDGLNRVKGVFESDTAPASGYPRVEFAMDGTNYSIVREIARDTRQANFTYSFDFAIRAPYVRVTWTQGSSASTYLRARVWAQQEPGVGDDDIGVKTALQRIRSDKDSEFTTAISQDDHDPENLTGLDANIGRIKSLTLLTVQNLDWEVVFWGTDGFDDADLDSDKSQESVFVAATDAFNIGNATATTYRYHVTGLDIPYEDEDGTNELHVSLIPRNGGKNAGAGGYAVLEVVIAPEA